MKKKIRIPIGVISQQTLWGFFIILVLLAAPVSKVAAGVIVAPSVIVLDDKSKTGRMNLQNPSNSPKEVSINFSYGIPESDSLGNVNIFLRDTGITDPHSALGWVKAFPRKLIIPANGSQVVRFIAQPPKGLNDGEYWVRVVVESQEGITSIPVATDEEQITTQLNMIMRTAVMLKYRTGELVASVKLKDTQVIVNENDVDVFVDLANTGNVSYIGLLECQLLDADKKVISTNNIQLALYKDLLRRINLPFVEGNFKKPYSVAVSVTNKGRKDIPTNEMVFGNDLSTSISLVE